MSGPGLYLAPLFLGPPVWPCHYEQSQDQDQDQVQVHDPVYWIAVPDPSTPTSLLDWWAYYTGPDLYDVLYCHESLEE